ncbi:MAG: hypothetical protein DLM52_03005 [Chthoniobacterales bacterium]|nr:MAG: hypothetical protein DLM52_03005 [Chthoniobacterales bacterium]
METQLVTRRVIELGALLLIGDGIMGLIKPRWHSLLWHFGPELVRATTEKLAEHPQTARGIYAAEVAFGILIASRQTPEIE